jgi:hypothetical protein
MTFKKGQSGNPAGCPKGAKRAVTLLCDEILNDATEDIMNAIVAGAKALDPTCVAACAKYFGVVRRGRRMSIGLPAINKPEDILAALKHIAAKVEDGTISAEEAQDYSALVEKHSQAIQVNDLALRIEAIERGAPLPPPAPMIEHHKEATPCPSDH